MAIIVDIVAVDSLTCEHFYIMEGIKSFEEAQELVTKWFNTILKQLPEGVEIYTLRTRIAFKT